MPGCITGFEYVVEVFIFSATGITNASAVPLGFLATFLMVFSRLIPTSVVPSFFFHIQITVLSWSILAACWARLVPAQDCQVQSPRLPPLDSLTSSFASSALEEHLSRLSHLANFHGWCSLNGTELAVYFQKQILLAFSALTTPYFILPVRCDGKDVPWQWAMTELCG